MKLSEIEKKILDFWRKDNTFVKSVEKDAPKGDYSFYDGPPFATGTPHYGHIVASLMKDMVPRYWTMRGYRVERRWGWDCHGLPIENIVEKEHGFKHKKDIEKYGIDKFNEDARSKVLKYADEWQKVIERMGRWVDFSAKGRPASGRNNGYGKGAYLTMDLDYMESIWWVFKQLYDKGLLYEAYRSMHICPRCETTLAQSEVAQGYKEVKDLSVIAKFRITKEALNKSSLLGSLPLVQQEGSPPDTNDITNINFVNSEYVENKNRSNGGPEGNRTPQGSVATHPATPVAGPRHQDRQNELYHNIYLLAWTTTPWTLPGNVALAVGEDIDYIAVCHPERGVSAEPRDLFIVAKDRIKEIFKDAEYEIIKEIKGKDLVGLEYEPLFSVSDANYTNDHANDANEKKEEWSNAFKVYAADFVNTEEGTGIVHIAPAFGEDDYNLSKKENLPFIQHVNMDGTLAFGEKIQNPKSKIQTNSKFQISNSKEDPILKELNGLEVKPKDDPTATDVKIIQYLAKRGLLFSKEKYEHSYPHCWRCDSPLLNYSTSSWFVAVEKIKKDLLKNAEKINWMPSHIKDGRFGQWLSGARDWSISRQRFWGSVLPIWRCSPVSLRGATRTPGATRQSRVNSNEHGIASLASTLARNDNGSCSHTVVIGSIAELEKLSGKKIKDLHKHFMDKITFKCEKCNGIMKRVPDVLDCWFESGSMPYAQSHYPFENEKKFKENFPAAFIAEGVDQTRAWFYYLHVLSTALKNKPAFKNVIVNGIVLAEDGKKMAKRLQNYPDPMGMFEKYGADAVRYYLATGTVMRAEDFNFSEKGVEEVVKKVIIVLYNILEFYKLYTDKTQISNNPTTSAGRQFSNSKQTQNSKACPEYARGIPKFQTASHILDKWIISKLNQFIQDVTEAYEQYDLNKATRPLAEFVNELSTWYVRRSRDRFKGEDENDKKAALSTLGFVLEQLALVMAPVMPFTAEYIWQEVKSNKEKGKSEFFKSIHLQEWPKAGKIDKKVLGEMEIARKVVEVGLSLRAEAQIKVRQPLESANVKTGRKLTKGSIELIKDELNVKDLNIEVSDIINAIDKPLVELNTNITPELELEGHLRELVRAINAMRKSKGLTPGDVISIKYQTESDDLKKVFEKFGEELKKSVIASKLAKQDNGGEELDINGEKIKIAISYKP